MPKHDVLKEKAFEMFLQGINTSPIFTLCIPFLYVLFASHANVSLCVGMYACRCVSVLFLSQMKTSRNNI